MSYHGTVSPATLRVERREDGIAVTYLDGRVAVYRVEPEPVAGPVRTPPGKDVHVLVTDPESGEGVMIYVNDRKTHDDVLEASGVGRVLVEPGMSRELFPGVEASVEGHAVLIDADPGSVDARIFVFAEDEFSEHGFELVDVTGEDASNAVAAAEDDTDVLPGAAGRNGTT